MAKKGQIKSFQHIVLLDLEQEMNDFLITIKHKDVVNVSISNVILPFIARQVLETNNKQVTLYLGAVLYITEIEE